MAKQEHALVNQDGSLVAIQMVESSKIASDQQWPKYFPVVRDEDAPTRFHSLAGSTAELVDDEWVITAHWNDPDLDYVKTVLSKIVDEQAEAIRLQFITAGAGQAMTYEAKRTESRRWVIAGEPRQPVAEDYPLAAARAARRSVSIVSVLSEWRDRAAEWVMLAAFVENAREGGKEAIAGASSVSEAIAAHAAIDWALPQ